ncbi:hypothetical protein [Caloranaerobacter ferrireducens]|uniref:hypothetical protein n=1 Tax=Caloranaerobacter ferrireducens TaxID=1323370 RepID=UPI00159F2576|nr:hypothetical protein [Caloranaerobacter ferrireducens]
MDNRMDKKNYVKKNTVADNAIKEAQNITGVVVGEFPNTPGLISKNIGNMNDSGKGRLE